MGRKAKKRAFRNGIKAVNLRDKIHPEICEVIDEQIRKDQAWFNARPGVICYFRPATEWELSAKAIHGHDHMYLCHPEEAPVEAQTWIALVDLPRLYGYNPSKSCRAKFRCLPVDFDDSEQVDIAHHRAIGCARFMSEQVQQGNAVIGHFEGPGGAA